LGYEHLTGSGAERTVGKVRTRGCAIAGGAWAQLDVTHRSIYTREMIRHSEGKLAHS